MNQKYLFDNDRLPCHTSDPTLSGEATTPSSLEQRAVRRSLDSCVVSIENTDTTSSTVVLIVTHYCVTVIIVRLALATALITLKCATPPWRRSVRLVGRSEVVTMLSEAHGASPDRLARLCLRGSVRRVDAIRLARVYRFKAVNF